MLAKAWFIARKDVQYMLRRWETVLWTFVMPIIFFYFIGTITAGFGPGPGSGKTSIALNVPADSGLLADQLVRRLEDQDYDVHRFEDPFQLADYRRRLTIPAGLTASVLSRESAELQMVRSGDGIGADYDDFRVGRAVYSLLADLIVVSQEGREPKAEAFEALNMAPRALTLEVAQAGERKRIPTGFEQAIPGTMVMFTLLVLLTSGAVLLVIERQEGLLRRLASTPISRGTVVLGKWGGRMALAIVQIGFAMIAGTLFFKVHWGPHLAMVLLVLFAYASLTAGLGILLGSLARTEGQAVGLGVLSANVLAALGGCWWPIEITPEWMQKFAVFLPTGATMDALHQLVSFAAPAGRAVSHVLALLAAALLVGWLSSRVFRYQ
ncbi:MAG: ABC transporter permease [Thermoanaerobaculia bacterium]